MTQQQRQRLIKLTVEHMNAEEELRVCPPGLKRLELEAKTDKLFYEQYQMIVELKADYLDISNAALNIIEPGSGTLFWLGDKGLLS